MRDSLGKSDMCVVSTYFNPCHYRARRKNFELFRDHLDAPLLVVEFSPNGEFELTESHADYLLRISPGAVLWQKERLLNLALRNLPDSIRYFAWVDCDFIFTDGSWFQAARALLDDYDLVQCFSELTNLDEQESNCPDPSVGRPITGYSAVSLAHTGQTLSKDYSALRHVFQGGAWAAKRALMEKYKFYDTMILGGGDRALSSACLGRYGQLSTIHMLNDARRIHYESWARPFHQCVAGHVGYLEGRVLHLWHGAEENRAYSRRHQILAQIGFDPMRDLRVGKSGAWEWTEAASQELRDWTANYFLSRQEDGITC